MESALAVNVRKDMDWLQSELEASTGYFLVGNDVTAADIMMHFSVQFTLARELGTKGGSWPKIDAWIKRCEESAAFKKAVSHSDCDLPDRVRPADVLFRLRKRAIPCIPRPLRSTEPKPGRFLELLCPFPRVLRKRFRSHLPFSTAHFELG